MPFYMEYWVEMREYYETVFVSLESINRKSTKDCDYDYSRYFLCNDESVIAFSI